MEYLERVSSDVARRFIEERGSKYHRAFTMPSYFNQSTSQFESKEVYDLRVTIECCKKKSPELVDFSFDPKDCSWKDVLDELEKAQNVAAENGRRHSTGVRRLFNALVDNYPVDGGPSLPVFPAELSILHGGLAVIFSMARHHEHNRLKILRAFEEIPNIIQMAQCKMRNFSMDSAHADYVRLHESVVTLQSTLLYTLPKLIQKLNPRAFLGIIRTSQMRGDEIDTLLDAVHLSAERVRQRAGDMNDVLLVETHRHTKEVHDLLEEVKRQNLCIISIFEMSGKNWLFQDLTEVAKAFLSDARPPLLQAQARVQSPMTMYPTEAMCSPVDADAMQEGRGVATAPAPGAAPSGPTITPGRLLTLLDVHSLLAVDDETYVTRHGNGLPNEDVGRAEAMVRTRQVAGLLSASASAGPGVVLVEACGERGKVSPVSLVCAGLAQTLRAASASSSSSSSGGGGGVGVVGPCRCVTLVFFCGLHVDGDDPLRGPAGMMRSLLAQLVLSVMQNGWASDWDPVVGLEGCVGEWTRGSGALERDAHDDAAIADDDDDDNDGAFPPRPPLPLQDVCALFRGLLARLVPPRTPVYCIVDGISYYEREDWLGEFVAAMQAFGGLIADCNAGTTAACFKLLMTSPTRSEVLGQMLGPEQRVSLRRAST